MSDFAQRVRAIDTILAGSTTIDRTLLDRCFAALAGIEIDGMPPKLARKLELVFIAYNEVVHQFPDASDPCKPLPASALAVYAYHLQQIRMLAENAEQ